MSDIQALIAHLSVLSGTYSDEPHLAAAIDSVSAALESQAKQIEELQRELGECSGGYQTLEREVASLKDALSLVIVTHDEWAAQMPAGQFDDPLSDAVEKARPFARTGQIEALTKDARRLDFVLEATDSDRQTVDAAIQAEEGNT